MGSATQNAVGEQEHALAVKWLGLEGGFRVGQQCPRVAGVTLDHLRDRGEGARHRDGVAKRGAGVILHQAFDVNEHVVEPGPVPLREQDVTLTPVRMRPEMRPPRETRLNEFPGQGTGPREIAHVEGQEGAAFEVRGPVGSTELCGECIESTEGVVRRREVAGPQLQSGRAAEERSERDQVTRLLRQALRLLEQDEVARRKRARGEETGTCCVIRGSAGNGLALRE